MSCRKLPTPIKVKCSQFSNPRVSDNYLSWLRSIASGTSSYQFAKVIDISTEFILFKIYHRGYVSASGGYCSGSAETYVLRHMAKLSSIGSMPEVYEWNKRGRITKEDKITIGLRYDLQFKPTAQHIRMMDL